jgi:hypothetical protein
MDSINVFSTINIIDDGPAVEVAIVVGFADFSRTKIKLKPKKGPATVVTNNAEAEKHYSLGKPSSLMNNATMVCTGRVADPQGATGNSFFVICAFLQGSKHIGSSDPVGGKFAAGEAVQDFNIICTFV